MHEPAPNVRALPCSRCRRRPHPGRHVAKLAQIHGTPFVHIEVLCLWDSPPLRRSGSDMPLATTRGRQSQRQGPTQTPDGPEENGSGDELRLMLPEWDSYPTIWQSPTSHWLLVGAIYGPSLNTAFA
jgi:hypothetical protein